MKKFLKLFLMLMVMVLSFTIGTNASADTGPKPYVEITIEGKTDGMFMTLLSDDSNIGPYSVYNGTNEHYKYLEKTDSKYIAHQKFIEYNDKDNYYYIQYLNSIDNNEFKWSYMPPNKFKILIYDSINDSFITDDVIYEKNEFASIYTLTLNETSFTVDKVNQGVGNHILGFFIRLIICLSIELLIALAFGFRKLELIPILIVNVITQIALNIILALDIYHNGFDMLSILAHAYIPMELAILVIEFLSYFFIFNKYTFKREIKINPIRILLYTLTANIISFFGGFAIVSILQNMGLYV